MTIIIDSIGIFNAVQRVAEAYGLQLQMEPGCTQPRTDLLTGVVIVPELTPYTKGFQLIKWRGEVYHEVGHHAPALKDTLPFMLNKGIGFNSLIGRLINIFNDVRNEMNGRGMYPGRDEALSEMQVIYCQKGYESLSALDGNLEEQVGLTNILFGKDQLLCAKALGLVYDWRAKYQPALGLPSERFSSVIDWSKYSHLRPLLDSLNSIEDDYNLAMKFIEDSPDHDPEEEMQKAQEAAKAEDSGEEEGEEAEGEGEEAEPSKVKYSDIMGHIHTGKSSKFSSVIEYDHTWSPYTPHKKMDVRRARDLTPTPHTRTISEITDAYLSGKNLSSVARRLFQSTTQTRKAHNYLTGRLDKRDLYRIPSGCKDVFTRKVHKPDPKGTALFLLTDASASMAGSKFKITAAAVALLNDTCAPLGIPMKVAAFTESMSSGCRHFIVKEYDENRKVEGIIEDYGRIQHVLRQNADGESILWAAKDLMTRPEPRKILIVLSDGQPCSDNPGDCYQYTKDVVQTITKWPTLETYGIGILDYTVEKIYPEYTVLKDLKDLEKCLIDVIKTKIFKL